MTVTFKITVTAEPSSSHSATPSHSSKRSSRSGGSHHTGGASTVGSGETPRGSGAGTAGSGAGMAGAAGTIHGAGRTPYSVGQSLNPGTLPLVSAGAAGTTGVPRAAGLGGVPGTSTRIPAGSASHLFPKINPGSAPSPAPRTPAPKRRALDQEATFPMSLGSSEFGAQIVGLIALVLAVAIAVTRISLRRSRAAAGRPGTGQ